MVYILTSSGGLWKTTNFRQPRPQWTHRRIDGGGSWTRYGSGPPFAVISDLYLSPDGSFLRASSYGRGVWEFR